MVHSYKYEENEEKKEDRIVMKPTEDAEVDNTDETEDAEVDNTDETENAEA